jgi:hypothetical protein
MDPGGQKHMDPTDPDPQHWQEVIFSQKKNFDTLNQGSSVKKVKRNCFKIK